MGFRRSLLFLPEAPLEDDRRRVRWDIEIAAVILIQVNAIALNAIRKKRYKYYRENAKETDLSRAISWVSFVTSTPQNATRFALYILLYSKQFLFILVKSIRR